MTDTPGPTYRSQFDPSGSAVEFRQPDDEDGVFEVRMPIATTGEVRNQGDEPLTREELEGMADQINNREVGVFMDHGGSALGGMERYSAVEKLGEWTDADVSEREGSDMDELTATARMMDPETLPSASGQLREALVAIKEQVKRGMSLSSSIGWRDDDAYPGGVDLMEASIVGIGADPRTTSDSDTALLARAAVKSGADPAELVATVRSAVESERGEYEVGDETITITPPDPMVNAAEAALEAEADADISGDCGTGVGSERANQIIGDDVGPEVIDEIAAYLTSHEEDVTAEGPPTDWSAEEWEDCGNRQYAKWGGTGSGEMMEWAQDKANEVADAKGEELPYPERSASPDTARPLGPPGDRDRFEDFDECVDTLSEDDDVTRDDAEQICGAWEQASGNAADTDETMSDDNDPPDDGGTDEEQDAGDGEESRGMEERMDEMREMLKENTEKTREMYEQMMGEDDDGDEPDEESEDEMEDDEDGEDDDEDESEQSAETGDGDERAKELESNISELKDELQSVRSGEVDVETPDTGDGEGEERDTDADDDGTEQRDNDEDSLRDGWLSAED